MDRFRSLGLSQNFAIDGKGTPMKWSNIYIGKKIAIGFVLVLILQCILGISAYNGLNALREKSEQATELSNLINEFSLREVDHLNWVARLKDLLAVRSADFDIELDPTRCKLGQWLNSQERKDLEVYYPGIKTTLADLEHHHASMHASAAKMQKVLAEDYAAAEHVFFVETEPALTKMRSLFSELNESLAQLYQQTSQRVVMVTNSSVQSSVIFLSVAFIVAVIMVIVLTRSITKPIKMLNNAMMAASQGDLTVAVNYDATDELGVMVQSFNKMVRSLNDILTASHNAVAKTVAASQNTSNAVREISAASEQIATSATEFANSATLINEQTNKINLHAQKTEKLAQEGSMRIESCIESMLMIEAASDTSSQAITELKEAVQQIMRVIQVVTDIAEQTNLLSLNAAIEAARAGEYGSGFAVVAEHIRKLSDQTKASLQEINNLAANLEKQMHTAVLTTNASRDKVQRGVELVRDTTKTMQDIVRQISEMMIQLHTIAEKTQEQAVLGQEIAAMTEEQSAATNEIAESAEELSNVAQHLDDVVKQLLV